MCYMQWVELAELHMEIIITYYSIKKQLICFFLLCTLAQSALEEL